MKNPSPRKDDRAKQAGGFALVVTLSLMILLTVVAVGLLSLSAITLRSNSHSVAQSQARANARLALMFAIGELQKNTGPDTRITASSSIVDPNSPPLTGAWKSWEGSNHNAQGMPTVPDYAAKKKPESNNGRFMRWLVSGAEQEVVAIDPGSLVSKTASPGTVPMLSSGTLGTGDDRQVHLTPQRVKLNPVAAGGSQSGGYAWWISGENQKANLAQPHKPRTDTAAGWADMAKSHAIPDPEPFGLDALLDDPENHTPDPSNLKPASKAISLATTDLLVEGVQPAEQFHDLSTSAIGLLTNTATGGWRKDMSIFTEKWASLPNSGLPLFRLSPTSTTSVTKPTIANPTENSSIFYPWSDYLPKISTTIYPVERHGAVTSWQSLVDYATSYKSVDFNSGTGIGSVPLTWSRIRKDDFGKMPAVDSTELYNYLHTVRKAPVLARVQWVFNVQAVRSSANSANQNYDIRFFSTPIYTLWNPHNVAIEVNNIPYAIALNKAPPVAIAFVKGSDPPPADSAYRRYITGSIYDLENTYSNRTGLQAYDHTIFPKYPNSWFQTNGEAGALPTTFSLAPGEVKSFSAMANTAAGNTGIKIDLKEGYDGSNPSGITTNITLNNFKSTDTLKCLMRFDNQTRLGNSAGRKGPGIMMNFGLRGQTPPSQYITDTYVDLATLTNLDFAQAYWEVPADLPEYSISAIATQDTSNPAQPTNNRPWTPYFSIVFGPRLTIGAGAGNPNDRPTKGILQTSPFVTSVLTTSDKLAKNHPVNGAYDFSFLGHEPNSDTLPEDSNGAGYISTGLLAGNGLSRLIMSDLPLRPIASLVELQGWDVRAFNPEPPFQYNIIGNSDANPMMPKDAVVRSDAPAAAKNLQHDDAYCANHLLFDDWFFSSIAPEPQDFGKSIANDMDTVYREYLMGKRKLVNRAYRPIAEDGALSAQLANERVTQVLDSADGWQQVASRFEVEGMFNINSTSVKAWRALLGHARKQQVAQHTKNGITLSAEEEHPVSRSPVASDVKAGPGTGMGSVFTRGSEYTGFRTLSNSQLDDLAEEIVEQVSKRGPFLSLSEFVNRKLDSDEEFALAGAVQTALNSLSEDPHKFLKDSDFSSKTMDPADPKLVGAGYEFPNAAAGMNTFGLPGWIRQADVLRPIAPLLSARDDTFTIRAYGDSRDASGNVIARAWCEAIVQRGRDFVDAQDAPDSIEPPVSQSNQRFGRRYKLVSFRWLAAGEV